MCGSTVAAVVLFAAFAGSIHGRLLQQTNYASAVSVSGGQGPYGNCGATQTAGNAAVRTLPEEELVPQLVASR